jgi:hypothetical protein
VVSGKGFAAAKHRKSLSPSDDDHAAPSNGMHIVPVDGNYGESYNPGMGG